MPIHKYVVLQTEIKTNWFTATDIIREQVWKYFVPPSLTKIFSCIHKRFLSHQRTFRGANTNPWSYNNELRKKEKKNGKWLHNVDQTNSFWTCFLKAGVEIIQGVIIKLEIDVHLLVTWEKREKGSKNQKIPKRLPNT